MTTVDAVSDAITIARLSVEAALRPLVEAQQDDGKAIRLYWLRQSLNLYPCVIHQNQDRGGANASFLGVGGWSGLWALRTLAKDQATADAFLAAIRGGMDNLALPEGFDDYTIQAIYEQPLSLPPEQDIWQAAELWRMHITRD